MTAEMYGALRWAIAALTVIIVIALMAECRKSDNSRHTEWRKEQALMRAGCIGNGGSVIESTNGSFHCVMLRGEQ